MPKTPVYIFTGFLESGKTTFIRELLKNVTFATGEKTLYILCETGIEEIDEKLLKFNNAVIVNVVNETDIDKEFLENLDKKYSPERVLIEYNGFWNIDKINDSIMPEWWEIALTAAIADASTFSAYMKNMSSIMVNYFKAADMVLFNRCDKNTNKLSLRAGVKAVNAKAQVIFKLKNGEIDNEDIMPFDINAEVIKINEYDYGVWYVDITENPEKYNEKIIVLTGMVHRENTWPKGMFMIYRKAMTCCIEDITMLQSICYLKNKVPDNNKWIKLTAQVKVNYIKNNKIPLLLVNEYDYTEPLKDEIVYFY